MRAPDVLAAMKASLVASGAPESELLIIPPRPRTPSDRYHETWTPSDPLDAVYWDLREFFRRGQRERLRKCPVCHRYFVQVTARGQTYCDGPCRLKANLTRPTRTAEYKRRHYNKLVREDLQKVRQAKDHLREIGATALDLSWVLETAGISSRRWTSLRQWEIEQYGKPQVTDITRRARPLARSG
jgi:Family of unknown function (DUF6076)